MRKILALFMLTLLCVGGWAQYTWNGGPSITADSWKIAENWTLSSGSFASNGPGTANSNLWDEINISNATGTTYQLEGWLLRMNLSNSTITATVNKIQNNSATTCYFNLSNNSTLNLTNGNGHANTFIVNFGDENNTMNFAMVKNHDAITINYGNVKADGKVNVFNVTGENKTLAGIIVNATLPEIYSNETTLNKIKLATIGSNVTVSNIVYNISGIGYSLSNGELTEANKDGNIGKYYYEKDTDGNIWLSWVTGSRIVYEVTYTFADLAGNTFTKTIGLENGINASESIPAIEFFHATGLAESTTTVSENNTSFTVRGNWNFPMMPGKFYYMKAYSRHGWGAVHYVSDTEVNVTGDKVENDPKHLWYVVYKGNNTFWLCNVEKEQAAVGQNTSNEAVSFAVASGNTQAYEFVKTNDTQFRLYWPNSTDNLGAHGNSNNVANAALGRWNSGRGANNGTNFIVEEFDESIFEAISLPNGEDGYVGSFKNLTDDAQTAVNNYRASKSAVNLKTALAAYEGAERITIDPDKFYQIISQTNNSNKGRVIYSRAYCSTTGTSSNYGDRQLLIGTVVENGTTATPCNSAVKFIKNGNGWTIQHANSQYYYVRLGAFQNQGNPDLPISTNSAGKYLLHNLIASDTWVLNNEDATNKYLHCGVEGDGAYLYVMEKNDPSEDNGLRWKIKEITEIPVVIGNAGYTTVCFPMAVTIPDNVTAYKVTAETETNMLLEPVTGSVAAKTPLILEKKNDSYIKFNVVASGDVISDNALNGATARRVGFADNSFYALAADNETTLGVSFKINGTVNAVPANKAYLPTTTTGSNKFTFAFSEDELTAIEDAIISTKGDNTYRDILGRPVANPIKGQIYIQNGKLIKY